MSYEGHPISAFEAGIGCFLYGDDENAFLKCAEMYKKPGWSLNKCDRCIIIKRTTMTW